MGIDLKWDDPPLKVINAFPFASRGYSRHSKLIIRSEVKKKRSIPFPNGVKTSRGNSKWTFVSILKILTNEHYKGYYKWTDKESGETYTIIRPRLISESLFNKVQKTIEKNTNNGSGNNTRKHESIFGQSKQALIRC